MTNIEFSSGFDTWYNNISSNLAPGLDDYEKSIFLTKAQDEILKAYFDPKSNKTLEGIDDSSIRLIAFSKLITTYVVKAKQYNYQLSGTIDADGKPVYTQTVSNVPTTGVNVDSYQLAYNNSGEPILNGYIKVTSNIGTFKTSKYDPRSNSRSAIFPNDILAILNEQVKVKRNDTEIILQGMPISYQEYLKYMNKPFKRPFKNQAWRLLVDSDKSVDIVVGPTDEILTYTLRYVRKPNPIILSPLSGITIDGKDTYMECELDSSIHQEILQRAVELAKAVYAPDSVSSMISVGNTSGTNLGIIPSAKE